MRRSVIFLGTPHEGSEQADNLQVLLGLASLLKIKVSDISEELETYSVTTMDINKSFMRNASRNLQLLCFYETVKTRLPQGDRLVSFLWLTLPSCRWLKPTSNLLDRARVIGTIERKFFSKCVHGMRP